MIPQSSAPRGGFPLKWPPARKRTEAAKRKSGDTFRVPFDRARQEAFHEVELMDGRGIVLSTNIPLRQDGQPYANPGRMNDPGIAIYFTRAGRPVCVASDAYLSIEANMQALNKTLAALRSIERWGGEELMDTAISGFAALEDKSQYFTGCRTRDDVDSKFRELAKRLHPDGGGSAELFMELKEQYDKALERVGSG